VPPPGRGGSPSALCPEAHNKQFLGLHTSIITVVLVTLCAGHPPGHDPRLPLSSPPVIQLLCQLLKWFHKRFKTISKKKKTNQKALVRRRGRRRVGGRPTTEAQMNMMSGSGSTEVPARHRGSSGAAAAAGSGSGSSSSAAFSPVADAQAAPSPHSSTRRRVLPGRPSKSNRGTSPIFFLFTSLPFVFSC
jgi:hypothetical protein